MPRIVVIEETSKCDMPHLVTTIQENGKTIQTFDELSNDMYFTAKREFIEEIENRCHIENRPYSIKYLSRKEQKRDGREVK
jgi:hypothetical protein